MASPKPRRPPLFDRAVRTAVTSLYAGPLARSAAATNSRLAALLSEKSLLQATSSVRSRGVSTMSSVMYSLFAVVFPAPIHLW